MLNPNMPKDQLLLAMGELTMSEEHVARSAIRLANSQWTIDDAISLLTSKKIDANKLAEWIYGNLDSGDLERLEGKYHVDGDFPSFDNLSESQRQGYVELANRIIKAVLGM